MSPIVSVNKDDNAALIAEVLQLYPPSGGVIADVTWGKGAFWTKADLTGITMLRSDLDPKDQSEPVLVSDFRKLPYPNASIDIVVLDPPYIHNPGEHPTDKRYNNKGTTKGLYHADIIDLYREGMVEARRLLRGVGSQIWVKCKDEVESGRQRWSHIELYEIALELGLYARDLFILVPSSRTSHNRWINQQHARKVHSYLWVFDVPKNNRVPRVMRKKRLEVVPQPTLDFSPVAL